jgi:hypothetical protein
MAQSRTISDCSTEKLCASEIHTNKAQTALVEASSRSTLLELAISLCILAIMMVVLLNNVVKGIIVMQLMTFSYAFCG